MGYCLLKPLGLVKIRWLACETRVHTGGDVKWECHFEGYEFCTYTPTW